MWILSNLYFRSSWKCYIKKHRSERYSYRSLWNVLTVSRYFPLLSSLSISPFLYFFSCLYWWNWKVLKALSALQFQETVLFLQTTLEIQKVKEKKTCIILCMACRNYLSFPNNPSPQINLTLVRAIIYLLPVLQLTVLQCLAMLLHSSIILTQIPVKNWWVMKRICDKVCRLHTCKIGKVKLQRKVKLLRWG